MVTAHADGLSAGGSVRRDAMDKMDAVAASKVLVEGAGVSGFEWSTAERKSRNT